MLSPASNYCVDCRSYCPRADPCRCCSSVGEQRRHSVGEDAMRAYERRVPAAEVGALHDATAKYARTLTIHLLDVAFAAMEDEGVNVASRRRVVNAMVYGGSCSPADVELRAEQQARFAEYVAGNVRPTPLVFNVQDSGEVERMLLHIKPKDDDDD